MLLDGLEMANNTDLLTNMKQYPGQKTQTGPYVPHIWALILIKQYELVF